MKRLCAACVLGAMAAGAAPAAEVYNYWIQPCTEDVAARSGCDAADAELAHWALDAWEKAAGRGLRFVAADGEYTARIRVYWLGKRPQLYGDTRLVFVNGKRGAAIEVHPDLAQYGSQIAAAGESDGLFRDTVVYLTCLHETGHAIGLDHTADFADIMYSFQYGGDVLEYFSRYRRVLHQREDIRKHTGISEADRQRVAGLYAGR
ncbi:MAG TPA: matrixin family metalloprotease [Bryobacteraceae bacterium]|jgi:hypothetical protein|nr:matrixin family metalloprotease [Bryobacteraceae bacterium]